MPSDPISGELGKFLALDAESLVVGKMPVQDVHLHRGHAVEVALEHVDRNEVAADVDQQCRAREARLIFDGDGGHGKSSGRDLHELKKSLQTAQHAQRVGAVSFAPESADGQFVGFVLAEFLHGFAAVVGMDLQRRRGAGLGTEWNSGLPGKLVSNRWTAPSSEAS